MEESMKSVDNVILHSFPIVLIEKSKDSIRSNGIVRSQLKDSGFYFPVCDRIV